MQPIHEAQNPASPVAACEEKQESPKHSPFEVEGIDLGLSREEIVEFVHEGRRGHESR